MSRHTSHRPPITKTLLALGWMAWSGWVVTASGINSVIYAQCGTETPGVSISATVPCGNATCAHMSAIQTPYPSCDNIWPDPWPLRFDSTAVTSWKDCVRQGYSGSCTERLDDCAYMVFYINSTCTILCEPQAYWVYKRCKGP